MYDETPRPVGVWGYVSRNAFSVAGEIVKSQVVVVVWVGIHMVLCVSRCGLGVARRNGCSGRMWCVLQFRSCIVYNSADDA